MLIKRILVLLVSSLYAAQSLFCAASAKNAILLIPDGMSPAAASLARMYKGSDLAIDAYACGFVKTHMAEGPITDSAAAATAMSTGHKTNSGFLACLPDRAGMPGAVADRKKSRMPVATLLEAAMLAGKSTGIVATSYVQHATPAGFTSHYPDREAYETIAEQQVYLGIDVVLGGGAAFLAGRKDGEELVPEITSSGYDYVIWPGRMRSSKSGKLWGMFAQKELKYEMDRNPDAEPSLAEMTGKAIETLSEDPDGFFLMVEGSKIDWAAHANDPAGLVSDILAFDEAAEKALSFAKNNKDTVVIIASDHCTGGLTLADKTLNQAYEKTGPMTFIEPLKKAQRTGEGLFKLLHKDRSNLKQVMRESFGISDLKDWEEAYLIVSEPGSFNAAAGPIISSRMKIGWQTRGHTADDTTLYCYSPSGKRLSGVIDNTQIALFIEDALGLSLSAASEKLFFPVSRLSAAFSSRTYGENTANPVLLLENGGRTLEFPANKNYAFISGKKHKYIGLNIYNGREWFIPMEAVNLAGDANP